MSIETALQIIKDYQIWRRGGQNPMPNPTYIGQALDVLIAYVSKPERRARKMLAELTSRPVADTIIEDEKQCYDIILKHLTQC